MKIKCRSCDWSGGEFTNAAGAREDHETHHMCFATCCGNYFPVVIPDTTKPRETANMPVVKKESEYEHFWMNTYLF